MKARTTVILVAVAAVVLALGLMFGTGSQEEQSSVPLGQLAFAGLTPKLQDVARLEVLRHGATLRLARTGAVWGMADRANYPADQAKVHQLIAQLTELKLDEPRTANPDDYAKLGVEDAQGKDANSTLVRLLDGTGAAVAELILGHQHTGTNGSGDGVYVRRPGEAQSWLAGGRLSASTEIMDWIDPDIADISPVYITKVVSTRDNQTLTFERKGDNLALTAPTVTDKFDDWKLLDINKALEKLRLIDVRPAPAPGKRIGQAVFTDKDGMAVSVEVNRDNNDLWVQLTASGDGAAHAAAEALTARTKGWAYRIADWKQQSFVPTLDELKAYEPPAGATPPPPPPGVKTIPVPGIPGLSIGAPKPKQGD